MLDITHLIFVVWFVLLWWVYCLMSYWQWVDKFCCLKHYIRKINLSVDLVRLAAHVFYVYVSNGRHIAGVNISI